MTTSPPFVMWRALIGCPIKLFSNCLPFFGCISQWRIGRSSMHSRGSQWQDLRKVAHSLAQFHTALLSYPAALSLLGSNCAITELRSTRRHFIAPVSLKKETSAFQNILLWKALYPNTANAPEVTKSGIAARLGFSRDINRGYRCGGGGREAPAGRASGTARGKAQER